MGKYMKKSKISGDIAVMEISILPQTTLGVRTRAKTLALLRQQQQHKSPSKPFSEPNVDASSFSYLQLRSRRLEKPPLLCESKKQYYQNHKSEQPKGCCGELVRTNVSGLNSRLSLDSLDPLDSGLVGSVEKQIVVFKRDETEEGNDFGIEASFGDNGLDFEAIDRSTRESTPCSLIREDNTVRTPGSTTRQTSSAATNRRLRSDIQRNIPTAREMEEFFSFAEQQQQRIFIDKYNFDVVNDLPLPGSYEWVQVVP